MIILNGEVKESLRKLIDYCWKDECRSWEEQTGKEFFESIEGPAPGQEDNHIFYDLFVLREFLNNQKEEKEIPQESSDFMETDEHLSWLLTDVIEGGYINYWADIEDVKRDDEGYVVEFSLKEYETTNPYVVVNLDKVKEAIRKIQKGEVKSASWVRNQFLGPEWNYGSAGGDVVVQIAVLGEIVYG
jgi:hypothetical protein